jgi:hypothetical protein
MVVYKFKEKCTYAPCASPTICNCSSTIDDSIQKPREKQKKEKKRRGRREDATSPLRLSFHLPPMGLTLRPTHIVKCNIIPPRDRRPQSINSQVLIRIFSPKDSSPPPTEENKQRKRPKNGTYKTNCT